MRKPIDTGSDALQPHTVHSPCTDPTHGRSSHWRRGLADWARPLRRCKPTDAIIQRLCAGGPVGGAWRELRELNLQGCCRKRIGPNAVGLSDAALASLAAGCPKLERVELSELKTKESFSVEALLELVNACPLKELVLERCSDVKLRHPSDAASRTVGPPFAWAINSILMRRGAHLRQLSLVRPAPYQVLPPPHLQHPLPTYPR